MSKGGMLRSYSAADGARLSELRFGGVPVLDGLAGGGGRLYVSTQEGAVADLRWTMLERPMAGRAVAVFQGDRGFFIEGAAPAEAWKDFLPTFEAMLQGITLE